MPVAAISARVPDDLAERFAKVAAAEDRTVSAALRRAMQRYIVEAAPKSDRGTAS